MKFKDPFSSHDLRVQHRLECFEVGFRCKASGGGPWRWKMLSARRWSVRATEEARLLALELMRESAARWGAIANDAFEKQRDLLMECSLPENGLKAWSAK